MKLVTIENLIKFFPRKYDNAVEARIQEDMETLDYSQFLDDDGLVYDSVIKEIIPHNGKIFFSLDLPRYINLKDAIQPVDLCRWAQKRLEASKFHYKTVAKYVENKLYGHGMVELTCSPRGDSDSSLSIDSYDGEETLTKENEIDEYLVEAWERVQRDTLSSLQADSDWYADGGAAKEYITENYEYFDLDTNELLESLPVKILSEKDLTDKYSIISNFVGELTTPLVRVNYYGLEVYISKRMMHSINKIYSRQYVLTFYVKMEQIGSKTLFTSVQRELSLDKEAATIAINKAYAARDISDLFPAPKNNSGEDLPPATLLDNFVVERYGELKLSTVAKFEVISNDLIID